jgi:hypothetical protein
MGGIGASQGVGPGRKASRSPSTSGRVGASGPRWASGLLSSQGVGVSQSVRPRCLRTMPLPHRPLRLHANPEGIWAEPLRAKQQPRATAANQAETHWQEETYSMFHTYGQITNQELAKEL